MTAIAISRSPGFRSALEGEYARLLDLRLRAGEIQYWAYEPMSLRIGGREKGAGTGAARYTPDFLVVTKFGYIELHETKGRWMEAAKVRLKVAADRYPCFRFVAVAKKRGSFVFVDFEPAGGGG